MGGGARPVIVPAAKGRRPFRRTGAGGGRGSEEMVPRQDGNGGSGQERTGVGQVCALQTGAAHLS